MAFNFDYRAADSPLVEWVYQTQTLGAGGDTFMSNAESHWEMVVTRQKGKTTLSMRGPESKASLAPVPADAEFMGIVFKLGVFMPHLPNDKLVNEQIHLPEVFGNSFNLYHSAWQFPTFENVDVFVARLVREGILTQDPIVDDALNGYMQEELSVRSVQRRFLRATGLTHGTVLQIRRAHKAAELLRQGLPILDVVDEAGYADQPHLTRSLKLYYGNTPAQLRRLNQP
jgi:hypothetical protein